jgi:hypothetical protein
MCLGGSPPPDNSAEIARQQEAERQSRIATGTQRINEQFGKFDNDYYSGLGKSYLDFYNPELDRQYGEAKKQLTYRFADSGSLNSGAANQKFGDLAQSYATQRNQVADRALGTQQEARGNVERNRADLMSQLEGGAGVESTGASALARANALTAPPQYSPLGDVFATFTGALAQNALLRGRGYPGFQTGGGGGLDPDRSSSVQTVN